MFHIMSRVSDNKPRPGKHFLYTPELLFAVKSKMRLELGLRVNCLFLVLRNAEKGIFSFVFGVR